MTTLLNPSNYVAIEQAIGNLLAAATSLPVSYGDFTKLIVTTPLIVVEHGSMQSPVANRAPNFEDYNWFFPVHYLFEYTSDAEAHQALSAYRPAFLSTFILHKQLDDGQTATYPQGIAGQALNSKVTRFTLPFYVTFDGKDYLCNSAEVMVTERLYSIWH